MKSCPACGVPVVPGYVRCPKCHAALPAVRFRKAGATLDPGGTAMKATSRFPLAPVVIAVIVGGAIIAYFGLRGGGTAKPAETSRPAVPEKSLGGAVVGAPGAAPAQPAETAEKPTAGQLASEFQRTLDKQRLWSTVDVTEDLVDIRSGACSDPAMAAAITKVAPSFKAAGLTRLRCLEQSGRVVIVRDL